MFLGYNGLLSQPNFNLRFPEFSGIDIDWSFKLTDSVWADSVINMYGGRLGNSFIYMDGKEFSPEKTVLTYLNAGFRGSYIISIDQRTGNLNWEKSYSKLTGDHRFVAKKIIGEENQELSFLGDYLPSDFTSSFLGTVGSLDLDFENGHTLDFSMPLLPDNGAFIFNDGLTVKYEEIEDGFLVFDSYRGNDAQTYVRRLNQKGLLRDTVALIPGLPGEIENAGLMKFIGLWQKEGDEYLSFHRSRGSIADSANVYNVITSFNLDGEVNWQKDVSNQVLNAFSGEVEKVEDRLYFRSNVNIKYSLNQVDFRAIIAQFDLDGNLMWSDILMDSDGVFLDILELKKSNFDNTVFAICRKADDEFIIYQYKKNGERKEIARLFNQNDDLKVSERGMISLKNGDMLLSFTVSPDTVISGDRVWEYVSEMYLAKVSASSFDYFTSTKTLETEPFDMTIFPNPSNSGWHIEGGENCSLILFNALGQKVWDSENENSISFINSRDMTPGFYFLNVLGNGSRTSKVFKLCKNL